MNPGELWWHLQSRGLVSGEQPDPERAPPPWYLRILLGLAGWLGSLFLLGFLGLLIEDILDEAAGALSIGLLLCGGAVALARRGAANDFLAQAIYAASLAGQAAILIGVDDLPGVGRSGVALAAMVLATALFFALPQALHRTWCAGMAALAAAFLSDSAYLAGLLPLLLSAAAVWLWLGVYDRAAWASRRADAALGATLALLILLLLPGLGLTGLLPAPSPADDDSYGVFLILVRLGYGLLWLTGVAALLWRLGLAPGAPAVRSALLLALPLAIAACLAPGLSPLLLLLVIGYAHGHRPLTGLATLALLAYLSRYYYSLELTLLTKSLMLMATGAMLLLLRQLLRHRRLPWLEAADA